MKIIFFGGAFDPFTNGHLNTALTAYCHFPDYELWIVPDFEDPLGLKHYAPFEHRMEMIRLGLPKMHSSPFVVSDICKQIRPSSTLDMLTRLEEVGHYFREADIKILIGGDQALNIGSWHNHEELTSKYSFIACARKGYNHWANAWFNKVEHHLIEEPPTVIPISSSDVRQSFREHKQRQYPCNVMLSYTVSQYAEWYNLYGDKP